MKNHITELEQMLGKTIVGVAEIGTYRNRQWILSFDDNTYAALESAPSWELDNAGWQYNDVLLKIGVYGVSEYECAQEARQHYLKHDNELKERNEREQLAKLKAKYG